MLSGVGGERELAAWLVAQRARIERALGARLGAAPAPASPEAEVLRRFRSFAAASLARGPDARPALEGLRASEARAGRLCEAWVEAAGECAGAEGEAVREALAAPLARFREALRGTKTERRRSGAPRPGRRRAVAAAIDRVSDVFLAIDAASGEIADANPAAGALLGTRRDALLGADALGFVPDAARERFWEELDAAAEGSEPRRFRTRLRDAAGAPVAVEASVTPFATRHRTLALVLARPEAAGEETEPGGAPVGPR